MEEIKHNEGLTQFVSQLHDQDCQNDAVFERAITSLDVVELGLLLEALPIAERCERWPQVPDEIKSLVLVEMRSQARDPILQALDEGGMELLLRSLDAECLIELSDNFTEELIERALSYLDERQKSWFESANQFETNQIGRYVDHKILTITVNAKVKDAIRVIKRSNQSALDSIYVLGKNNDYRGAVKVKDVLRENSELRMIRGMIDSSTPSILATESLLDAVDELERSGAISLPVINSEGGFIGQISLPTALSIVKQHYDGQLMAKAGMAESDDLFVPILTGARSRAIWLGINLITAFLASWTIGLFEDVLSKVVALAVLMPVVASMGGIAGSQTLALIIRGLAVGQVTMGNAIALCRQELGISIINGVGWAIVIGVVAYYWFGSFGVGSVIAVAVFANIQVAAVSGVYLPLILARIGIDPALSGAVLLTTVTDVFGFITFLGLGALILV